MRPMFRHCAAIAAVLAGTACGGAKEKQPEAASAPPPAAPPSAAVDSTANAPIVDSTTKAVAARKKAEGPLRDSAAGPKFSVDSNGKVTPIPPPAKRP